MKKSKNENEILKKRILELENNEKELNYKIIESSQKIKSLSNMNQIGNNKEPNDQVNKLKEIINEKEITISKLIYDKNNLEKKMVELERENQDKIKSMMNYKNNQINIFKNLLNKQNSNISLTNVQAQLNKMRQEITSKNNLINSLNQKITQFNNDYKKKLLEIKQSSDENMNQTQEQVEQLIIERDELLRKNENLTQGLMQFNDKVKEVHLLYNKKTEAYHKNVIAFKSKMKQYETRIKQLVQKNNELKSLINNCNIEDNIENENNYLNLDNRNEELLSGKKYTFSENNNMNINKINNKCSPYITNSKKNIIQNNNMPNNNRGRKIFNNNMNNINSNNNLRNLTYEIRESQKYNDEEQNDLLQKNFLENYKTYLSELK